MAYNKAKSVLWISAIIILIAGIIHLWLPGTAKEFYLSAFNKFYVIDNMHLTLFLCFILIALGAGYFMLKEQGDDRIHFLTPIHVVVTLICAFVCWISGYMLNKNIFSEIEMYSAIFGYALIGLIAIQILYFIQLIRVVSK